jgi:hypothetical protein
VTWPTRGGSRCRSRPSAAGREVRPTTMTVYDVYWRFAAARQQVYRRA